MTLCLIGVIFFGGLMSLLSLRMIIFPIAWAKGIIQFSRWRWFHRFEILSRLVFALIFYCAAMQSHYPKLHFGIAVLLTFTTGYLIWLTEKKHKQFAIWSARKFKNWFRPLGFITLILGGWIIRTATISS